MPLAVCCAHAGGASTEHDSATAEVTTSALTEDPGRIRSTPLSPAAPDVSLVGLLGLPSEVVKCIACLPGEDGTADENWRHCTPAITASQFRLRCLPSTCLPSSSPSPAPFTSVGTPRLAARPAARLHAGPRGLALLAPVRQNPRRPGRVLWCRGRLAAWNAVLAASARRAGRALTLEIVLRKQHYLQACAQGSVLLYWGWHWRQVYDSAHLIAAQLLFAYAFDMLLSWSRRDTYTLGFGPFPVIFSINLFLWFKPDWFYLQFLMVAVGFAAKELIRWNKDGRRAHIFNPSSFPLAVFSLGLLADRHERHHLGHGDCDHAVLSAAHVPDAVSRSACRDSSSSA